MEERAVNLIDSTTSVRELRELIDAKPPCLSIIVDRNEFGDPTPATSRALQAAKREIQQAGMDADAIVGPVMALIHGAARPGTLAVFRSRDHMLLEAVGPDMEPCLRLGERFDPHILLSAVSYRRNYSVLALSQSRTRILKCTRQDSEELPWPAGFPGSLAESMQTRPPDHMLDNKASAGPSQGGMKGVMFGTSADREAKDEYLLHFFRSVDQAVHAAMKDIHDPLIMVGVEHEIALYRRVNTYPRLIDEAVHGAPDGLAAGEVQRRALEVADAAFVTRPPDVLADFDKKVGTGHASVHMQEIVAAAYQGRISHLFFQKDAHYVGVFDRARGRVKHTTDPVDSPLDLVGEAAIETIRHGGEAGVLRGSAMPNGSPVCALFRYPAAEPIA